MKRLHAHFLLPLPCEPLCATCVPSSVSSPCFSSWPLPLQANLKEMLPRHIGTLDRMVRACSVGITLGV